LEKIQYSIQKTPKEIMKLFVPVALFLTFSASSEAATLHGKKINRNDPSVGVGCVHKFELELQTGEYGGEISWELTDPDGNVVFEGGDYPEEEDTFVHVSKCLSSGKEHLFKIMDSYGDGMVEGGYYKLSYDGEVVVDLNGDFEDGFGESVTVPGGEMGSICDGHVFELELQTDIHGNEISWELEDPDGNIVREGGDWYPSEEETYDHVAICLPSDGEYTFKIYDSYGDGMKEDAGYVLFYDGEVVVAHDGEFGLGESVAVPGGEMGSVCDGHEFELELLTDDNGNEVSWELADAMGNIVRAGGDYPPEKTYEHFAECLYSDEVFTFKIMDSAGNGMEGDAGYVLFYDGEVVVAHDGQYEYEETIDVPGGPRD